MDIEESRNRTSERYRELITETSLLFPEKTIGAEFPTSVSEWEAYAAQLRTDLMEALNFPQERVDLEARTVGKVDLPGITIEKVIYLAEPGSRVTANLYIPGKMQGPVPAFVMCSGSNASKDVDFNQIMGQYLADAGCLCLIPDTIGEGDRRVGGCHVEYVDEFLKLNRQLYGKFIFDLMRGVDYLLTRPEVDPRRIGTSGHSLGGGLAAQLAAFDPRIQLSIPASPGFLSKSRNILHWRAMGAQAPYRMGRLMSAPEIIALIAPREVLIVTAEGDFADPDVIQENIRPARHVYRLYGKEENLAEHRVTDGSGHGPHFLSREALQFVADRFGFPRLDRARIDSASMVNGQIDWYPRASILDLPRRVFPSVIPPHLKNASHCPELDCLGPVEALEAEYHTPGWLEILEASRKAPLPKVESWDDWLAVRDRVAGGLREVLGLPAISRKAEVLKVGAEVERTRERVVELVTVGLPPVEGFLLASASGEKADKAVIYLHESRTKEGALACSACTGYLSQGYRAALLLDAVASEYSCNNDIYYGFCTPAVNVVNVHLAVDYLASQGYREITVVGEMDDIAALAAATDERITSVVNGPAAASEPVTYVPKEWGWTYWEGTVPGIDTVADRAVVLACVAPRPLALSFQHMPEFTSRVYQLWEEKEAAG